MHSLIAKPAPLQESGFAGRVGHYHSSAADKARRLDKEI